MIVCQDCYVPMVSVMTFSKNKHERFCRCPMCMTETKHIRLNDSELNFGECLHSELNKKGK